MNQNHNTHLISSRKELKQKGVMIRKWDYNENGGYYNPSMKNLNKQIKTLHSKLKKNDTVYTEYSIENYINEIAEQRNIPVEVLGDLKNMMIGSITSMEHDQRITWSQKQAYIGLGFSLVTSAVEGVDSTPMEGFVPAKVDEVLGLSELGLKSAVILTLGYRDTENDSLSTMKKVRRNDLFIRK